MIESKINNNVTRIGFALLVAAISCFIAKVVLMLIMIQEMIMVREISFTIAFIIAGVLIFISNIKKVQGKSEVFIKTSLIILICIYVFFMIESLEYNFYNNFYIYELRWIIQDVIYIVGYVISFITVCNIIKKPIASRVLLIVVAIMSVVESGQMILEIVKWDYDAISVLYTLTSAVSYLLLDISIALIIPNVITKKEQEKMKQRHDFDSVYYLLETLKDNYEKGIISKEQYENMRKDLLKKL